VPRRGPEPEVVYIIRFTIKMQSLFRPVGLSPKGDHVRFHGSGLNQIDSSLFHVGCFLDILKEYTPVKG